MLKENLLLLSNVIASRQLVSLNTTEFACQTLAATLVRLKHILKYVGLGLLLLGTILNILMFVSQAWPTYMFFIIMAIGLVFILLSYLFKRLKTSWQLIISTLPFMTAYIFFQISSASNDIFLIPNGFRGQVTILYDRQNGQVETYEGNWRVYNVPSSGILETKFKLKAHKINLAYTKYYFVDSLGNRIEIKHYCNLCKDRDTISVQVIYGELESDKTGIYQTFSIDKPSNRKLNDK